MQTFPALSLDQLMRWLREALASPTLEGMPARLLAAVLVTFHNSRTGATFPSLRTLARRMGCTTKTVIAAYRALEADGRLMHIARRSGPLTRDKMSHQYVLLLKGDLAESRAAQESPRGGMEWDGVWEEFPQGCAPQRYRPVGEAPTNRPSPIDQPERPEDAKEPGLAADTGKPEEMQPEQTDTGKADAVSPLPCSENRCVRLAQRIQRLANDRG
jgi:hypothetical protein